VRDYAQVKASGEISQAVAHAALAAQGVDEAGLDELDRKVLRTIIDVYGGGPVGIEALAAALNEERDTIVDVVEPYLLSAGLLKRTARGRKASRLAYQRYANWKAHEPPRELFADAKWPYGPSARWWDPSTCLSRRRLAWRMRVSLGESVNGDVLCRRDIPTYGAALMGTVEVRRPIHDRNAPGVWSATRSTRPCEKRVPGNLSSSGILGCDFSSSSGPLRIRRARSSRLQAGDGT
jgi:hypothetical protein